MGTSPFDLVVTRHRRQRTVPECITNIPGDVDLDTLSPASPMRFTLQRLAATLQHARTRSTQDQKRYKENFDRKLRFNPKFHPGDLNFLDQTPRTNAVSRNVPPDLADAITRELIPKSHGPYVVKTVIEKMVALEQYGLLNKVSIDRINRMRPPFWS